MIPGDWSDPKLFYIKRSLSRYEKSSLLANRGFALILPGLPGDTGCPEVDELIEVGYPLRRIVGVEKSEEIAEAIWDYYLDTMQVHCLTLEEYLSLAKLKYSYIHADLCGFVTPPIFESLDYLPTVSDSIVRIRISSLRPRKKEAQSRFEETYHKRVLKSLCRQCGIEDVYEEGAQFGDASQLLVGSILCNYFLGISPREYSDQLSEDSELPPVRGSHVVHSLVRGTYYDSHNSSMVTTWVDLVPVSQTLKNSPRYGLALISTVLTQTLTPMPSFNIPEFYRSEGENRVGHRGS